MAICPGKLELCSPGGAIRWFSKPIRRQTHPTAHHVNHGGHERQPQHTANNCSMGAALLRACLGKAVLMAAPTTTGSSTNCDCKRSGKWVSAAGSKQRRGARCTMG